MYYSLRSGQQLHDFRGVTKLNHVSISTIFLLLRKLMLENG
jgi:hypothetical protein